MSYVWLEAQRKLMQTLSEWAIHTRSEIALAESPGSRVTAAGCDWLCSLIEPPAEPPPFGISTVQTGDKEVAVDEQVVDSTPFCALRKFTRIESQTEPAMEHSAPACAEIFLCAPLAGHHAVMLRETVETLLQDGNVYITDWTNARDVPPEAGRFGLDDYVLVIQRFLRTAGSAGLHVVAICQATGPTLAAIALSASAREAPPRSLTLMGGPIDARLNPTLVDRFAQSYSLDWFRAAMIDTVPPPYSGAGRRVYPGFIQHAVLVAAHPYRHWALKSRYRASLWSGDARAVARDLRRLDEYAAVLDMAEDYFLDTIRVSFQEHGLAYGTWQVGNKRVRPQDISRTALCTVEGAHDTITGAGQTHAAQTLCRAIPANKREIFTVADCDHYDLFTGPRWHEVVHPTLAEFWRATG